MQFIDVLRDICSQVGDPNMESLKSRAKDHFFRAVTSLLDSATENDLPGYHTQSTFTMQGSQMTLNDAVRRFKAVYASSNDIRVIWKSPADTPRLVNSESRPAPNEVFIWQNGKILVWYKGDNVGTGTVFTVEYEKEINSNLVNDTTEITNLMASSFVRKAITLAADSLLTEDAR